MRLFDRRRKSLRFIALASVCLLFSGLAFAVLAQHKDKTGMRYYAQENPKDMPIYNEGLRAPAPGLLPNKPAPMPKRYSFSTPFIWTFELFLIIYGSAATIYLYRRYKTRFYRTR